MEIETTGSETNVKRRSQWNEAALLNSQTLYPSDHDG